MQYLVMRSLPGDEKEIHKQIIETHEKLKDNEDIEEMVVTNDEIEEYIRSMKRGKASGPYGVESEMFKELRDSLPVETIYRVF